MRRWLSLLVGALAIACICKGLESNERHNPQTTQQASPSPSEAQTTIRVNSNLVILPVTVKDARGVLVPDLQKDDFHVFDNNVEQSIDVFTAEAFPLSLVVLVDDDLKPNDAEQMVASLRALAAGISADDEAMICRFDLKFYPGEGFASDLDRLMDQLKAAQSASGPSTSGPVPFVTPPSSHPPGVGEPGPGAPVKMGSRPTKALDDAVFSAAEHLHDRGRTRRKLILIVSDGLNGAEFNHHNYEDTLSELLHENIAVYSLAVGGNTFRRKFTRLRSYANDSGGDIYYAAQSGDMEKLYSKIAEQARHEYTLAFVPTADNRTSNYHAIEVRTARPGLHVKTRHGYYANQAANSPAN